MSSSLSIALIVGGWGDEHHAVSVTERTREIGIRKARRAAPRHRHAISDRAMTLSAIGGVIGSRWVWPSPRWSARQPSRDRHAALVDRRRLMVSSPRAVFGIYPAMKRLRSIRSSVEVRVGVFARTYDASRRFEPDDRTF